MTSIIPAKGFVILKPLMHEKTKSGLELPPSEAKQNAMGRVYKVGAGKQPFPQPMKEGDLVLYEKYMDNTISISALGGEVNPVKFDSLTALIREEQDVK